MSAPASKPIRSPSYPSMSLSDAVASVRKIEALYRLSPVDRVAGAKLIGYSSLSGPANAALAALAQYGLVERAGKGEMRVTARAQAILHPNNDAEKKAALAKAAFEPTLFRELRERWPDMIPPEDGIANYLNRQGFNQTAIRPAVKAYIQTLHFLQEAGVSESHGLEASEGADLSLPVGDEETNENPVTYGGARVGDLIQWETGGALQLERPARVRLITDDGQWVAVDGSESGVPMSEVIVQERSATPAPPPPRFAIAPEIETVKVGDGEAEWIHSDLGSDTKVRLIVKGEMGPKQIGKLIKLLQVQQSILNDDDD